MNLFVVAAQPTLTNIVSSLVLKSFRANYKLACEWQRDVYFLHAWDRLKQLVFRHSWAQAAAAFITLDYLWAGQQCGVYSAIMHNLIVLKWNAQ